jgi:hypothetical protein
VTGNALSISSQTEMLSLTPVEFGWDFGLVSEEIGLSVQYKV